MSAREAAERAVAERLLWFFSLGVLTAGELREVCRRAVAALATSPDVRAALVEAASDAASTHPDGNLLAAEVWRQGAGWWVDVVLAAMGGDK